MALSKHQLFLEIPEVKNTGVLQVTDSSIYTPVIPVTCAYLEVTPPGFKKATVLSVVRGFRLTLNACSLGIAASSACLEDCPVLPDGIYHFRYSVSPNEKVFVGYDHLRVAQLMNAWYQILDSVELAACEPDNDKKGKITELYLIRAYIDAAKTLVEDKHDNTKGMALLLYSKKRLEKMLLGCPSC